MKYTGLPAAGAGSLNEGCWPDGTGVPPAASRVHELAGLVTPGKAVNDECCVVAPVSRMVPVKVMSPRMPFVLATVPVPRAGLALPGEAGLALPGEAGLALPDEGAAAEDEADDDVLEPADGVAPADGGPDELQAATAATSSRPAAAARPLATAGRRVTRTAGIGCGCRMNGV